MALVVRRAIVGLIVIIIVCIVIAFSLYWTVQRIEVRRDVQRDLNATFNTHIHINGVKLDATGSVFKWLGLPFRKHDWFVIYHPPQGGTSMGIVGENQQGQWRYQPTVPSGW